jgi:hypothetical protein
MATSSYLLLGHVTADLVAEGRVLGGTVSYAVPLARAFGHQVRVLTSCGACEPLLNHLLPHADISVRVATETTTFENIYEGNKRLQVVHDTADDITLDWLPMPWRSSSLVHLAPLVDDVDPHIASQFPDATVLLTPQGLLRQWGSDGVVHFRKWLSPAALRAIDIVVMSKQDIAEAPELEEEYAHHARCLVVTDSTQGGAYYLNNQRYTYDAYPAIERHPTGAGDTFATALLASLPFFDNDMHRAIRLASHLSALAVQRDSSEIALTVQQVQSVLHEHQQMDAPS